MPEPVYDRDGYDRPLEKRTAYVAHEILQMKPVFSKDNAYGRFITSNAWVYRFYPNARRLYHAKRLHVQLHGYAGRLAAILLQPLEFLLRIVERAVIAKNRRDSSYRVTSSGSSGGILTNLKDVIRK
jgi:hypothetical protein